MSSQQIPGLSLLGMMVGQSRTLRITVLEVALGCHMERYALTGGHSTSAAFSEKTRQCCFESEINTSGHYNSLPALPCGLGSLG
jgi:Na+/glutamate symporter